MKERPILFSGPMVRAILDGSKTLTRRVVKPQPPANCHQVETWHHPDARPRFFTWTTAGEISDQWEPIPCPYGQPSDRLWVRETWAYGTHALASKNHEQDGPWVYAADNPQAHGRLCDRWRPSIHMFRSASRITLEVTGVRVERLQNISDDDANKEGAEPRQPATASGIYIPGQYRLGFRDLWESINGDGSWDANPWVWVVSFNTELKDGR